MSPYINDRLYGSLQKMESVDMLARIGDESLPRDALELTQQSELLLELLQTFTNDSLIEHRIFPP